MQDDKRIYVKAMEPLAALVLAELVLTHEAETEEDRETRRELLCARAGLQELRRSLTGPSRWRIG